MRFRLLFSLEAKLALENLEQVDRKKYQKVLKTLALMEVNLRHPSLTAIRDQTSHKKSYLIGSKKSPQ